MTMTVQQEWKYTDPLLFRNLASVPLSVKSNNLNENTLEINDNNILYSESSEYIKFSIGVESLINSYFKDDFNIGLSNYILAGDSYNSLKNNSIFVHVSASEEIQRIRLIINNSKNINADIQIHLSLIHI